MIELKDLLGKWSNVLLSEKIKIESLKNVLQEIVKIKIEDKDIKIKGDTVYLNIKPIYKNEIFIHQSEIISTLEKVLGRKSPKNIR